MDNLIRLRLKIERLRRQLNNAADSKKLLEISRRLDMLIIRYQKMMLAKKTV